jgi:hypothetical protein
MIRGLADHIKFPVLKDLATDSDREADRADNCERAGLICSTNGFGACLHKMGETI